jgi:hypothetical protein
MRGFISVMMPFECQYRVVARSRRPANISNASPRFGITRVMPEETAIAVPVVVLRGSISNVEVSGLVGAVRAAVDLSGALGAMTDYSTPTMAAFGSQFLNCALKTVKNKQLASHHHVKALVVFVAAGVTYRHVRFGEERG